MSQYFNLTLDTVAPVGQSISGLQQYYKFGTPGAYAANIIATGGASYIKVWTDTIAAGDTSKIPSEWAAYNVTTNHTPIIEFSEEGTNYVHAIFMDNVGNISDILTSDPVIYDTTSPTCSLVINNGDGYTKNTQNTVRVTFSDSTSGVNFITLSGDIADAEKTDYTLTDIDRQNGYKDLTVTFSAPDGVKTVNVRATDFAGNQTAKANQGTDTIVFDTTTAEVTALLRESNDSSNLPAYVNYRDYGVRIVTEATDITHYKIWEGVSEPTSWTTIDNATEVSGVGYFIDDLQLSTGDGLKTIHVKVQDIAGNITEATALTTTLDTTAPTVTLSSDVSIISAKAGYNTVTFTCEATDTNSSQGLTYELKLGNSVIKSGTFTNTVAVTQAEINAISSNDGNKTFVLYVTDIAGNTGESTAVTVAVDTAAPQVHISADNSNNGTVEVYFYELTSQYEPIDGYKLWYDNNSEPSSWSTNNTNTVQLTNVPEGVHIIHYKVRDSVDNIWSDANYIEEIPTYDSNIILVDMTPPTGTISTNQYTNSRNITVNLTVSDATLTANIPEPYTLSDMKMKVWEAGTTEPAEWETYASSKTLVLSTGDGTKTINVKFKDGLNNENATVVATCSTVLDTDEPDVTLVLVKTDNATTVPAHTNVRDFNARIGFTAETQDSPIVSYKLTGDFTDSSDTWHDFIADNGKSYMTVSGLQLTDGDGLKTVTALLKDSAGNVSATGASVSVTYDSAPPVIDVNAPDYNIVSKEHTLRLNASGATITGKYNDVCTFTWSANEILQAFKVCVNEVGQTAAGATAIGTTHGSQNMSGGTVAANTEITSVIFSADFAATDAVNDTDGVYEVIVYGMDEGGTWSAVHVLS